MWVKEAIDLHHLERGLPEATFYVFIFNLFSYFTASKSIYSLFILHLEKPSSVGDTKGESDGPATTKLTIFLRKKRLKYMNKFAVNMRQYIVYSSNTF